MNYDRPELRNQLAAAYVLGTLTTRARKRFDRLLSEDQALQKLVADWVERLMPMGATTPNIEPSPEVWSGIRRRIGAPGVPEPSFAFWTRWFGQHPARAALAGISLFVLALIVIIPARWGSHDAGEVLRSGERPTELRPPVPGTGTVGSAQNQYVGFLTDANGAGTVLIRAPKGEARLEAEILRPFPLAPDQVLRLWAIRPNAAPESLGVIAPNARTEIRLAAPAEQALSNVSELAVSAQPSREGQPGTPTLPYLSRGPLIKTW